MSQLVRQINKHSKTHKQSHHTCRNVRYVKRGCIPRRAGLVHFSPPVTTLQMQLVTLFSLQQGQSTPWSEQRENCSPVCSKNMVRSDLNSSCSSACLVIAKQCCYQELAPLSCGSISLPQGHLQNKDKIKISFYLMKLVFTGLPKVNSREMNFQECIAIEAFK